MKKTLKPQTQCFHSMQRCKKWKRRRSSRSSTWRTLEMEKLHMKNTLSPIRLYWSCVTNIFSN